MKLQKKQKKGRWCYINLILSKKRNFYLESHCDIENLIKSYYRNISIDVEVPELYSIIYIAKENIVIFKMEKIEGVALDEYLINVNDFYVKVFYQKIIDIFLKNLENDSIIDFKLSNFIVDINKNIIYVDFYPPFSKNKKHVIYNDKTSKMINSVLDNNERLLGIIIYFIKAIINRRDSGKLIEYFIDELEKFNFLNYNPKEYSLKLRIDLLKSYMNKKIKIETLKERYLKVSYWRRYNEEI